MGQGSPYGKRRTLTIKEQSINAKTTGTKEQLARFKEMAKEVQADKSPDALDRAFGRLDMKKKAAEPEKRPKGKKR